MFTPLDLAFMRRALELSERGLYTTTPNPRVGAVLVKDGKTIGEGFHQAVGEPHAEANAVLNHLRQRMRDEFVSAAWLATVQVGLHDMDGAFASLAQAATEHSYYAGWWKVDPELDPLRSDPRFTELLKTVGLD